jgi:formate dehydrogenase major subunit
MLIKRTERGPRRGALIAGLQGPTDGRLDRRSFLRRSGLAAGSLATLGALPLASVRKAQAGPPPAPGAQVITRKSICTHCAVGCTVTAEVSNGVWIGQEPSWDSPINRGSHCAKGAAVRELVSGERRLKYPMRLTKGQWTRISWDQAIGEIGDKLIAIREQSGPDSVYWLGSAKMTNERGVSVPQVWSVLGDQQHGSSGAHLSFDHGHRRCQYLGLRRDDQQLQ